MSAWLNGMLAPVPSPQCMHSGGTENQDITCAAEERGAEPSLPSVATQLGSEGGATCIACGIGVTSPGFSSAEEQRDHFKTDWHR